MSFFSKSTFTEALELLAGSRSDLIRLEGYPAEGELVHVCIHERRGIGSGIDAKRWVVGRYTGRRMLLGRRVMAIFQVDTENGQPLTVPVPWSLNPSVVKYYVS